MTSSNYFLFMCDRVRYLEQRLRDLAFKGDGAEFSRCAEELKVARNMKAAALEERQLARLLPERQRPVRLYAR